MRDPQWKYGSVKVHIVYMRWPGKFVWIFLKDRGCYKGMYPVLTIGMDGVE